jgi:tRNA G18 (ribose-2'-O)-methylase SpoU
MNNQKPIIIIESVRSAENVGSIFRTADAAGFGEVYLVGYTPLPIDRFGRDRKDIAKVALGAEKTIPWKQVDSIHTAIQSVRERGYMVVAIEQSLNARDYKTVTLDKPLAFIVGNELSGVSIGASEAADYIIEIPQKGKKESLNVAVAFGIAVFRVLGI